MPEPTYADIMLALRNVVGDVHIEPHPVHPEQAEADARRIERHQDDLMFAQYVTDREMDGAAADAWYRDRGGWDG